MMSVTVRENLIEALEGRTPKTTPYSVYDWNMGAIIPDELTARMQEPVLMELYEAGKALFLEEQRLLAEMPGRYVNWLETLAELG